MLIGVTLHLPTEGNATGYNFNGMLLKSLMTALYFTFVFCYEAKNIIILP